MAWLKKTVVALLGLIAVLVVVGFFLPAKTTVVRTVQVQAAPGVVYALVADPKRWNDWAAWNRRDPAMAITYSGAASGAGAGVPLTAAEVARLKVRPDGSRRHCVSHVTPLTDSQGQPIGAVSLWTDITAHRQSEVELRTYELVANSITDLVSVVGEDGVHRMVNDAWCRQLGTDRHAAIGRVGDPLDEPALLELVDELADRRRRDLLVLCEMAEREGPVLPHRHHGGVQRGRHPTLVLLAQESGQPSDGHAQGRRHLVDVGSVALGGTGVRDRGGRPGHGSHDTRIS
mgnify:CR=1 FL=1